LASRSASYTSTRRAGGVSAASKAASPFSSATRAEAEARSRAMESEMDRGIFVSRVQSEKTTLAEALGRYERALEMNR
jgi:hypothetical protein